MSPEVRVLVDELELTRPASLELELSVGIEADAFQFTVENPGDKYTDLLFDTQGKQAKVELQGRLKLRGILDSADFKMLPEATVDCSGRDMTGVLIDELVPEALADRLVGKSSRIVSLIAKEYKFVVDADEGTASFEAGALPAGTSVWAVVRTCAEKDGFDAYVDETGTLLYKRREVPSAVSLSLAAGKATAGVRPASLAFHQDKTLSLALKVKVIGYDTGKKRRIVYTAESKLRNRPNYKLIEVIDLTLTDAGQVRARAEALLQAYSKGLVCGSFVLPWEYAPARRQAVEIAGCRLEGRYFVTGAKFSYSGSEMSATVAFANRVLAFGRDMKIERDTVEKTPKERKPF